MVYFNGQKIDFSAQITIGGEGVDFIPPTIAVEDITNGHRILISYNGELMQFDVLDGEDGRDGTDGVDGKDGKNGTNGVSPTISVSAITNGNKVTITDVTGTKTFNVLNGADGKDYVLTEQDIKEILDLLKADIEYPTPSSVLAQNGQELRFFVGTKDEYNALSDAGKNDGLFAIITDDNTREEIFRRIEELEKGIKLDMPPIFSGQMAAPFDKAIYLMSLENTTINLYVPEPVGPGSLQYSTEFISEDGVVRRLKFYNGILYVQKKNSDGDFETDTDYNEDIKIMKLASVYQ